MHCCNISIYIYIYGGVWWIRKAWNSGSQIPPCNIYIYIYMYIYISLETKYVRYECSIQKIYKALSLPSPRNLAVTVRIEKCIEIKEIKRGKGSLLLLPERKVCLYFFKTKTTVSHKVIYFKRNKLYKIRLCIFFPMLVVIFWVVDICDMNVVGEKCVWLQNKERIDTHNNTKMML